MTVDKEEKKPQLILPETCKKKHTYWSYNTAHKAAQRRNKAAGYKYLRAYNSVSNHDIILDNVIYTSCSSYSNSIKRIE